jgi:hypothetical protein
MPALRAGIATPPLWEGAAGWLERLH